VYDSPMKPPMKNIILGWLFAIVGVLPPIALVLVSWVGFFNYFDRSMFVMAAIFCSTVSILCFLSAVYFFRNGRIHFVRKILSAPLWVNATAIVLLLVLAGAAYEWARNGSL